MFGAIYGDIIGSYYEVHCTKNYNFEFHKDSFLITETARNDPIRFVPFYFHRKIFFLKTSSP